jgi:hypothetical protein
VTYRDFEIVAVKHVRRRGKNVELLAFISRATESWFLAQATHDDDGNRFGVAVVALTPTDTIPPAVLSALHADAQQFVDDHPGGGGR